MTDRIECTSCGIHTTDHESALCSWCRIGGPDDWPDEEIALSGGEWTRDGLTQRWEPTDA